MICRIIGVPIEDEPQFHNWITGDKHYTDIRALAAKSNVVVDLQFTGFDLTDEPSLAINRILDRIASPDHRCAFWG